MKEIFVHFFKYDLEVLILASEDVLLKRLMQSRFSKEWIKPVADQNHHQPSKRIVEVLFQDAGLRSNGSWPLAFSFWLIARKNRKIVNKIHDFLASSAW